MQAHVRDLGRTVTFFAAAAVIIGIAGIVLGARSAIDGEWAGYAALLVGMLGFAAGLMIFTGVNAGSALDGMNIGVLWAVAHLPYLRHVNREAGIDQEYPLPAFGAIFTMGSSTTVNGEVVRENVWGIGFMGVILVVLAVSARKDRSRVLGRQSS